MERWEKQIVKKRTVQKELVDLLKRKKDERCENPKLERHLKRNFKFIIIAFLFDFVHYNIYPLFAEGSQLYVYDATQSIAFLFYIYAIYKLIPKQYVMYQFILSCWLWFSLGDVFNVVYNTNLVTGFSLENVCLLFNVFVFSYKFRYELYLRCNILICRLKLVLI